MRMGRFCILCTQMRPSEAFGGKGERTPYLPAVPCAPEREAGSPAARARDPRVDGNRAACQLKRHSSVSGSLYFWVASSIISTRLRHCGRRATMKLGDLFPKALSRREGGRLRWGHLSDLAESRLHCQGNGHDRYHQHRTESRGGVIPTNTLLGLYLTKLPVRRTAFLPISSHRPLLMLG